MASTEGESSTVPSADVPDLTMQERLYALNHTMASTEGESSTVPSADVPNFRDAREIDKNAKELAEVDRCIRSYPCFACLDNVHRVFATSRLI
jgi:hypothetical protein